VVPRITQPLALTPGTGVREVVVSASGSRETRGPPQDHQFEVFGVSVVRPTETPNACFDLGAYMVIFPV
jgi:hypothetical protein